ncbi:MAG TPA: tripartite tricarboxylate transporter substrate binding protein [Xanthobacteraceae bacterium]
MRKRVAFVAVVVWFACALAGRAGAEDWPARPVRIVAPFAPGGTSDTLARILANHLGQVFHQTFYIENRPGAGGMLGSADVAAAEPDGYTLLISGIASHVIAPAYDPSPRYDGVRDFTHIAYLGGPPVGLLVHPGLGPKSYGDFLAYAKQRADVLDYTSSGTGTLGFLVGDELAHKEKLRLNHIPYKGGGPALLDLVGGHVRVATMTFSSAAAQVRAGAVLALAVTSERRLAHFPDLPTFKELGYDLVATTWFALSGPPRLPREIVEALNRETQKVLQQPDVHERLAQDEIELKPMTPDELTAFFRSETARWTPAAKAAAAASP